MRPDLAVTTALLLLLGTDVAKAADSVQLAETAGFLLGRKRLFGAFGARCKITQADVLRVDFLLRERGLLLLRGKPRL